MDVAPYVGAWIETPNKSKSISSPLSHPTWVRGLKQKKNIDNNVENGSHPTWVRGLKQYPWQVGAIPTLSHPTWVRGLKLESC